MGMDGYCLILDRRWFRERLNCNQVRNVYKRLILLATLCKCQIENTNNK